MGLGRMYDAIQDPGRGADIDAGTCTIASRRMRAPSTALAFLAVAVALASLAAGPADANIYYRTGTSTENVNGSTSVSMTVPSGVAVGDLLVADVDAAGTTAVTPPSGWTSIFLGAGFAT